MKHLKKLILTIPFLLASCGEIVIEPPSSSANISTSTSISTSSSSSIISSTIPLEQVKVQIININDLHGAVEGSYNDLATIGGYLDQLEREDTITIRIANGDMFQGTALSNYNKGRLVVDILNELNFDAFTIGNHEFDWGVDVLRAYQDGNLENGEANFPFLGANIYEKASNSLADFAKEYTIIEKLGWKIAVIGVIGQGLEGSISASKVNDYQFKNPTPVIEEVATRIRLEEDVDLVVVANHNGGQGDGYISENTSIANFGESARIDAILNGHTHQEYITILENGYRKIPVIQSGANGQFVGTINFNYSPEGMSDLLVKNIPTSSINSAKNIGVAQLIQSEKELTDPYFNEVLGVLGENTTRNNLARWEANIIKQAFGMDIAMVNAGGIRAYNFYRYDTITRGDVVQIMPFDNIVKTVELTGRQVKNICEKGYDIVASSNFTCDNSQLDGVTVEDTQVYQVGAIDYIFDKTYYDFLKGDNIQVPGYFAQELMIMEIIECMKVNTYWYPSSPEVYIPYLG